MKGKKKAREGEMMMTGIGHEYLWFCVYKGSEDPLYLVTYFLNNGFALLSGLEKYGGRGGGGGGGGGGGEEEEEKEEKREEEEEEVTDVG